MVPRCTLVTIRSLWPTTRTERSEPILWVPSVSRWALRGLLVMSQWTIRLIPQSAIRRQRAIQRKRSLKSHRAALCCQQRACQQRAAALCYQRTCQQRTCQQRACQQRAALCYQQRACQQRAALCYQQRACQQRACQQRAALCYQQRACQRRCRTRASVAPPLLRRRRLLFVRDATYSVGAEHSRDQTLARVFGLTNAVEGLAAQERRR